MATQSEFLMAINQLAADRGIDPGEIIEAVKESVRTGFKKDYPDDQGTSLKVEIDATLGTISVFADKKVVKSVSSPATQISLAQAQRIEPKLKEGDHVEVDVTPQGDFGRVAAQAARQVILQKIREAEKEAMLKQFKDRMGEVESAIIQRVTREGEVIVEINRATAVMPDQDRIPGEFYKSGTRVKVLLKQIKTDAKGKTLIVSRSAPEFLAALFALEVPEMGTGTVEIVSVAREAGSRSKIAVKSNSTGVDPIGSCVGQRGVRINAVTNELRNGNQEEKIDIINWDEDIVRFIANAIKPADALEVKIISDDLRQALILVDDESLSLAIGREGQNVRLAAKLTGWNLDIQGINAYKERGEKSTFEEGIKKESKTEEFSEPEVEAKPKSKSKKTDKPVAELELGSKIESAITAAGINTVSELKSRIDAGEEIKGVGPKSLEKIKAALA